MNKKGKFANKGKNILKDNKPQGIGEFLSDPTFPSEKPNQNKPAQRRDEALPRLKETPKPIREEFKFKPDLSEILRRYAFNNKTTKTATVTKALEEFFARVGER